LVEEGSALCNKAHVTGISKYRKLDEKQKSAATDLFTEKRYKQFAQHMPKNPKRILDIVCIIERMGSKS